MKNTGDLNKLKILWEDFGKIPVTKKDLIDKKFLKWPRFTHKEEIWHWFDEQCPNNLHDDLMFKK